MKQLFDKIFKEIGYSNDTKIIKSNKDFDYQCDDLFKLAKIYHKSPMVIGKEVVDKINNLSNFTDYFDQVTLTKPGFINIMVSDKYICQSLRELMSKPLLGIEKECSTIVLDYGGPNIAKPLHVGHLRSAIIGQAINNILTFTGNKVISDVHLGDIGLQMGQVIYGIKQDYPNVKAEDVELDLDYLNIVYPKISLLCKENEEVKNECTKITKQLQDGDKECLIYWKKIMEISKADIKQIYDYLSVHFDYWYGESDAYKYFDEMLKYIEKQNVLKLDEGAKIIEVQNSEDKITVPPCIIQKSNGAYLYATSDLGTIWFRSKEFNPNEILYVVDARQKMHFIQIFRAAKKSHIFEGKMCHYGFGTVNGKDNKPFKTRDGKAIKLADLIKQVETEFVSLRVENKNMSKNDLEKIVNAILKFADLQNDFEHNYIFDIKKFSEVNGKTGPYILYTYLRINKIISGYSGKLTNNIYNVTDRSLRLKLLEVSEVINRASKERKPHYIATYLYELATILNNFYQNNRIKGLKGCQKNDFQIVLVFSNKVLKTLLKLLGIDIPKEM